MEEKNESKKIYRHKSEVQTPPNETQTQEFKSSMNPIISLRDETQRNESEVDLKKEQNEDLEEKIEKEETEKDTLKPENQPNIRENTLFTYGITIHDGMPAFLFEKSIDSVIASYKEMLTENIPIDIIISIDAFSEKDYIESLSQQTFYSLYKSKTLKRINSEIENLN